MLALIFAIGVEVAMLCGLTAIMTGVIDVYSMPVPVLSLMIPGLMVDDLIGFFLAIVVVGTPIFTWRAVFTSTLFIEPSTFFYERNNVIWFSVWIIALLGVFALETFAFYWSSLAELENIQPCSDNNPFRPPEVCDEETRKIEEKIARALPFAFLISMANILIGAGTAHLLHKRQENEV